MDYHSDLTDLSVQKVSCLIPKSTAWTDYGRRSTNTSALVHTQQSPGKVNISTAYHYLSERAIEDTEEGYSAISGRQ